MYGFQKKATYANESEELLEFRNENFKRGCHRLLPNMKRKIQRRIRHLCDVEKSENGQVKILQQRIKILETKIETQAFDFTKKIDEQQKQIEDLINTVNSFKSQSNRIRILEEKITKTQIENQKNRYRNKETSFSDKEEINNLQMVQQQFYTSLQQTNVFAEIISKQIGGILRKRAGSPSQEIQIKIRKREEENDNDEIKVE